MTEVSPRDVADAIGRVDELITREVLRTGASLNEFRRALAMVRTPGTVRPVDVDLPPRMQRLCDLLAVAIMAVPASKSYVAPFGSRVGHYALSARPARALPR